MEIQRLIGRSLRACIDTEKLGERTITIDCDVLQADGGTRTASISGAYVALNDAIQTLIDKDKLTESPIRTQVAAISVGMYEGRAVLDLDYVEDSSAETDMNIVMDSNGGFIEIQGTAEDTSFSRAQLIEMVDLAELGIGQLFQHQNAAMADPDEH